MSLQAGRAAGRGHLYVRLGDRIYRNKLAGTALAITPVARRVHEVIADVEAGLIRWGLAGSRTARSKSSTASNW